MVSRRILLHMQVSARSCRHRSGQAYSGVACRYHSIVSTLASCRSQNRNKTEGVGQSESHPLGLQRTSDESLLAKSRSRVIGCVQRKYNRSDLHRLEMLEREVLTLCEETSQKEYGPEQYGQNSDRERLGATLIQPKSTCNRSVGPDHR